MRMLFAVRREEGALYPTILLDDASEVFNDDAAGGYATKGEVIKSVWDEYGQGAVCISQRALGEEVERRQK
jgi:hypothetical protein